MVVWNSYVAENYYHILGCCEALVSYVNYYLKPQKSIYTRYRVDTTLKFVIVVVSINMKVLNLAEKVKRISVSAK